MFFGFIQNPLIAHLLAIAYLYTAVKAYNRVRFLRRMDKTVFVRIVVGGLLVLVQLLIFVPWFLTWADEPLLKRVVVAGLLGAAGWAIPIWIFYIVRTLRLKRCLARTEEDLECVDETRSEQEAEERFLRKP